jgi:guanylate kinase
MTIPMAEGELYIVSAPSGAGKTTLCREVCQRLEGIVYSVSFTTRPPRRDESHGRDYFFVDDRRFMEMVNHGEFLEWARIHQFRYGTSKKWVQEQIASGQDVILDIDIQGAAMIGDIHTPVHRIFVLPPSWQVLKDRLFARGTESPEQMEARLRAAKEEVRHWEKYDYVILNDRLEQAVVDFDGLIRAQRCKTSRRKQWIAQWMDGMDRG